MKLSKQEQILIGGIAIFVIGFSYYQFIIKPHHAKNEELHSFYATITAEKEEYDQIIATMQEHKDDHQKKATSVDKKTKQYYSAYEQEQIIIDLNNLLSKQKLTGGLTFSQLGTSGVVSATSSFLVPGLGSVDQLLEQYNLNKEAAENNETLSEQVLPEQSGSSTSEGDTVEQSDEMTTDSTNTEEEEVVTTSQFVQQVTVGITVDGPYKQVQEFIKSIETFEKRMIVSNSEIRALNDTNVSASLSVEIYIIPDVMSEIAVWGLTGEYGKDLPFSATSSVFTQNGVQADENKRDFVVNVKSAHSDLSSVMIGRADDTEKTSYLVSEKTGDHKATMTFAKREDTYTYEYTLGDEHYPESVEVFVPNSEYIIVDLVSEARIDTRDSTTLSIDIKNTTDRKVVVFVRNDDLEAPRITVNGDNDQVIIVKQ